MKRSIVFSFIGITVLASAVFSFTPSAQAVNLQEIKTSLEKLSSQIASLGQSLTGQVFSAPLVRQIQVQPLQAIPVPVQPLQTTTQPTVTTQTVTMPVKNVQQLSQAVTPDVPPAQKTYKDPRGSGLECYTPWVLQNGNWICTDLAIVQNPGNTPARIIENNSNSSVISTVSPLVITQSLRPGATGSVVAQLQERLQQLGYYSGALDGNYNPGLTTAVMNFQRANNLTADGIFGQGSAGVLNRVLGNTVVAQPFNNNQWLASCATVPGQTGTPRIEILSPNGGEVFTEGQPITVTWRSCNTNSESVSINLIYNNTNTRTVLQEQASLSGTATFTVPSLSSNWINGTATPGKNFRIRVIASSESVGSPTYTDISNDTFTINAQSLSTVTVNPLYSNEQVVLDANGDPEFGIFSLSLKVENNSFEDIFINKNGCHSLAPQQGLSSVLNRIHYKITSTSAPLGVGNGSASCVLAFSGNATINANGDVRIEEGETQTITMHVMYIPQNNGQYYRLEVDAIRYTTQSGIVSLINNIGARTSYLAL